MRKHSSTRTVRLVGALAAAGLSVIALTSCSDTPTGIDGTVTVAKDSAGFGSFKNGTLAVDGTTVEVLGTKFIPAGEKGNPDQDLPALKIEYEVTHTTEHGIDLLAAWFAHFKAIQTLNENTVVELGIAESPSDFNNEIPIPEKDKPMKSSITYQVSEADLPVELIATDARSNEIATIVLDQK